MEICATGSSIHEAAFEAVLIRLAPNKSRSLRAQVSRMRERFVAECRSHRPVSPPAVARMLFQEPVLEPRLPKPEPCAPREPAPPMPAPRGRSPQQSEDYSDLESGSEPFAHTKPTVVPKQPAAISQVSSQMEQLRLSDASHGTRLSKTGGKVRLPTSTC